MQKFTPQQIFDAISHKGYYVKDGVYQMNIFGIRNTDPIADTFDDSVGLLYKDERGIWLSKQYDATTDPGTYYRLHPMNVQGVAIMIPGQYHDVYKIGMHKDYQAMQQIAPIDYVRDNNKDGVLNWLYKVAGFKKDSEIAATNIHHASNGAKSTIDWNWSAGCQVIADIRDFNEFMMLINESVHHYKYPNLFDYTLLEVEDFK